MEAEKFSMSESFTFPRHWKRWAFGRGYSMHQVLVLCEDFKQFYLHDHSKASYLTWEKRFRKWVLNYQHEAPKPSPTVAEPARASNPAVAHHYLELMKNMFTQKQIS